MYLPDRENALVDLLKLSGYCLSSTHPVGKHKAAVFRSALGFTDADSERLRQMLLDAAAQIRPWREARMNTDSVIILISPSSV